MLVITAAITSITLEQMCRRMSWGCLCVDVFFPLCSTEEGRTEKMRRFFAVEHVLAQDAEQMGHTTAVEAYRNACISAGLAEIVRSGANGVPATYRRPAPQAAGRSSHLQQQDMIMAQLQGAGKTGAEPAAANAGGRAGQSGAQKPPAGVHQRRFYRNQLGRWQHFSEATQNPSDRARAERERGKELRSQLASLGQQKRRPAGRRQGQ